MVADLLVMVHCSATFGLASAGWEEEPNQLELNIDSISSANYRRATGKMSYRAAGRIAYTKMDYNLAKFSDHS